MGTAANALNRIGYLHPPLFQSNLVRAVADPASSGSARFGQFPKFRRRNRDGFDSADKLFCRTNEVPLTPSSLLHDDAEGEPVICAIVSLESAWPAVAPRPRELRLRLAWDSSALPSRWKRIFPTDRLPDGQECILKAWSYDADARRAYRLQGSAIVTR